MDTLVLDKPLPLSVSPFVHFMVSNSTEALSYLMERIRRDIGGSHIDLLGPIFSNPLNKEGGDLTYPVQKRNRDSLKKLFDYLSTSIYWPDCYGRRKNLRVIESWFFNDDGNITFRLCEPYLSYYYGFETFVRSWLWCRAHGISNGCGAFLLIKAANTNGISLNPDKGLMKEELEKFSKNGALSFEIDRDAIARLFFETRGGLISDHQYKICLGAAAKDVRESLSQLTICFIEESDEALILSCGLLYDPKKIVQIQ